MTSREGGKLLGIGGTNCDRKVDVLGGAWYPPMPTRQTRRSAHMPAAARGPGPFQDWKEGELRLLGTRAMESGSGVGEFERDEKPLFGSESPGFQSCVVRAGHRVYWDAGSH